MIINKFLQIWRLRVTMEEGWRRREQEGRLWTTAECLSPSGHGEVHMETPSHFLILPPEAPQTGTRMAGFKGDQTKCYLQRCCHSISTRALSTYLTSMSTIFLRIHNITNTVGNRLCVYTLEWSPAGIPKIVNLDFLTK